MSNLPPWISSGPPQRPARRRRQRPSEFLPSDPGEALVWVLLLVGVVGVVVAAL